MSNTNYTLEVISHHSKFKNKSLKKYYVDGIETVGAWGDEPFEIRFKNNTYQKVQVKISVDGTDIFTGKTADTEVSEKMWVVNGYDTLSLKAWPESNNGGAAFVFTNANNSVAIHTHGDLSSRGIIAAAVFTEGHVEPVRLTQEHHYHYNPFQPYGPYWLYNNTSNCDLNNSRRSKSARIGGGGKTFSSNSIILRNNINDGSYTLSDCSDFVGPAASLNDERSSSDVLRGLVAVGAGQHVNQKITYVQGLIKPTLSETVRVRYLWWDELVEKLRSENYAAPHASGFPGDKNKRNIDLKGTPRIGKKKGSFRRSENMQPVFNRI